MRGSAPDFLLWLRVTAGVPVALTHPADLGLQPPARSRQHGSAGQYPARGGPVRERRLQDAVQFQFTPASTWNGEWLPYRVWGQRRRPRRDHQGWDLSPTPWHLTCVYARRGKVPKSANCPSDSQIAGASATAIAPSAGEWGPKGVRVRRNSLQSRRRRVSGLALSDIGCPMGGHGRSRHQR
jgi:hypothetical protein